MKIIHTSDWHLGQNFFEYDRREDHNNMIDQLADLIKEEEPDALVIAGDVYDIAAPNTSVQRELAEYIVRLHDIRPEMVIVCISGNHDSASRHEIYQTPWEALNVHMTGKIDSDVLENNIIPVRDKGWIVTVPYTNERFLNDVFFSSLESAVKEHTEEKLPIVYVGHAAISGRDFSGHQTQNEKYIGGIECTSIDKIGEVYDYVALGHIHKQQAIDKKGRVWYSGTPIAVSFDEVYSGNEHGVLLVDCPAHKAPATIKPVAIHNIHPLVNLPYEGFAEWEKVKELFAGYDADIPSFIRLNVEVDGYLPIGANDEAKNIAESKACKLCYINSKRKEKEADSVRTKTFTTTELKQIDFMEVAQMYIESQGEVFDDDMKSMLEEVKELLNQKND